MSFFPSLQSHIQDKYNTKRVPRKKSGSESVASAFSETLPSLAPVAYYPSKIVYGLEEQSNLKVDTIKNNIESSCKNASSNCKYSAIQIGIGETDTPQSTNLKAYIEKHFDVSDFLQNKDDATILCELPNLLVILGYKYDSTTSNIEKFVYLGDSTILTKPVIYLTPITDKKQDQYNACQAVMARTRTYNVNNLTQGGAFYGIQDVFVKLKSVRYVLLIILILSVYLLVQGTLASADLGMNIANLISNRNTPSTSFIIGVFLGILIPGVVAAIMAKKQIEATNQKFGTYDISESPYGKKVDIEEKQKTSDITLIIGLIVIAFISIMIIYTTLQSKSSSNSMKMIVSAIFFFILTITLFLLFYWAPLVSYANDEDAESPYSIRRKLKVWLTGDDREDIQPITSNLYIDRFLRRFFAIYAVIALVVAAIYILQEHRPVNGFVGAMVEGFMASCAILALPILWIFNWMIGIKLFMGYPLILMMVRYLRYPLYYVMRSMYLNNPDMQRKMPHLRAEFEKPENYSASWDLLGLTLFKSILKMSGSRALYSELFMDSADSYKDISKNSYVTGHFFRLGMKSSRSPNDTQHHGMSFIATFLIVLFLIFGVIGKQNVF
jgi:hypothetical protein